MPLWELALLVIAACMGSYLVIIAHKQEDSTVKQMGYLVGVISVVTIAATTLWKAYYIFNAFAKL
ncbi:MAG: hypothetical protein HQ575_04950 [Candidatus Omnitrophica bacterium]|nr:hypothetical protein [Candidatus Omnitrophota bacterium]